MLIVVLISKFITKLHFPAKLRKLSIRGANLIIREVFLKVSNFTQFSYIQPFHHGLDSFLLCIRWIEKTLQTFCKVLKTSQIILSPNNNQVELISPIIFLNFLTVQPIR